MPGKLLSFSLSSSNRFFAPRVVVLCAAIAGGVPASSQTIAYFRQFTRSYVPLVAVDARYVYVAGHRFDPYPWDPYRTVDFVKKFDKSGTEIWDREFCCHAWGSLDDFDDLAATPGCLFVAGRRRSISYLQKLDSSGNEVWIRSMPNRPIRIAADAGGVYVAGSYYIPGDPPEWHLWIRKYGFDGSALWEHLMVNEGEFAGLAADESGMYLSTAVVVRPEGYVQGVLRKYSSEGAELWIRRFNEPTGVGLTHRGRLYVPRFIHDGSAKPDSLLVLDAQGTELWRRTLDPMESMMDLSVDDTGIHTIGRVRVPYGEREPREEVFVRKYDFDGNALWTTRFGTSAWEAVNAVASDWHGIYGVGRTDGTLAPPRVGQGEDAFLVKIENKVFPVDPRCAVTVSSQVTVARSGFRLNALTGRYTQMVTLTNASAAPIQGPVSLSLDGLSDNATLANRTGMTTCVPAGMPYIGVNIGADNALSAGEAATVVLEFTNPTNQGIAYTARVASGSGAR